jgi:hypothetical protein
MKLYWSYLSQIVGDESIGVWKQLETDNFRMKDALTNRAKCIEYVDMATKRNADMKALLNQYLGDEKNTLFQVYTVCSHWQSQSFEIIFILRYLF